MLKDYFSFSNKELVGIIVLVVLILAFLIAPQIIKYNKSSEIIDVSDFSDEIEAFEYKIFEQAKSELKAPPKLFKFDPNSASKEDLLKLGLSKKQVKTLINYRKSGGIFKSESDLKKVYGISNKLYDQLKPFIRIEKKMEKTSLKKGNELKNTIYDSTQNTKKNLVDSYIIELNTADSIDLIKLPGIGPSFSKRIIAYRKFLGGYYQKDQLKEVFGLNEEKFSMITEKVKVDTTFIIKINLNTADFKTINKHPYLNYKQTKQLLKYRDLMKSFKDLNSIIENHLLDSITYRKIKPYLVLN